MNILRARARSADQDGEYVRNGPSVSTLPSSISAQPEAARSIRALKPEAVVAIWDDALAAEGPSFFEGYPRDGGLAGTFDDEEKVRMVREGLENGHPLPGRSPVCPPPRTDHPRRRSRRRGCQLRQRGPRVRGRSQPASHGHYAEDPPRSLPDAGMRAARLPPKASASPRVPPMVLLTLRSPFERTSGEAGLMWLDANVLLWKQEATMASKAETRIRDLLGKLREEMRWLDVLRMLSAGRYPLLEREGFEEKIKAKASSDADDDAQGEDARIDGATLVRDSLAKFTLPDWLSADLELTEAWFLERAGSNDAFEDEPPQRSVDVADDFGREALAALERIVELMKELEPMCTAAVEPIGAFNFWQLHTWAGIMLRGELAMSDQIGYAIGTPEEIANLDRLARRKAAEWMDQHERLAAEILAEGPLTDDELHAEFNRRWTDPAVRERLSGVARPWGPGSVVLMPPSDER